MPYIRGSEIDERYQGSLEQKILAVKGAVEEQLSKGVTVLATQPNVSLVVDEDGLLHEAKFQFVRGEVKGLELSESDIPVYQDEDMPVHIAGELRDIVGDIMEGRGVDRTRVREVSALLGDDDYWLTDVIEKLSEAAGEDSEWFQMYEANRHEIRTKLYGQIREMESVVPKTRYSRLPTGRLSEFEGELRESMSVLAGIAGAVVDDFGNMVFDEEDEFLCAVRQSLIAEAQATKSLLSKAAKLMASEDMPRAAEAHDGLAERAKKMVVVSEWIKTKALRSNEE